jgi:alcohol dehydrogenase (NADP+)
MHTLSFANKDQMPILGLGTWKARPEVVGKAVREALRIGYRHIDCAPIYGNEREIGKAVKDVIDTGEIERKDLWITSKLWNNAHAAGQVEKALKKSLQDLGIDYLDLYLIHWPVACRAEVDFPRRKEDYLSLEEVPLSETWDGMEACVHKGLTRHIGVANFSVRNLSTIIDGATINPAMNQVELHPYLQQKELLIYCRQHDIHLTAYSPLGSGDRPSALKNPGEPSLLEDSTVTRIARAHGISPAQVLIRWSIERVTSVIPKSTNKAHLAENFASVDLKLSGEDMADLAKLDNDFRYVDGRFWTENGSPYKLEDLWG